MMESYEKQQEALSKSISKLPDNAVSNAVKQKEKKENGMRCSIAHRAVDEALKLYESGALEWEQMTKDIADTLKAIGKMKDKDFAYEEEDED